MELSDERAHEGFEMQHLHSGKAFGQLTKLVLTLDLHSSRSTATNTYHYFTDGKHLRTSSSFAGSLLPLTLRRLSPDAVSEDRDSGRGAS
jgi:hypothetical protein